MNLYYVYGHYKPNSNELFYVGKGKNDRAWYSFRENKFWKNVVKKHNGFDVEIMFDGLEEEEAIILEIMLIEFYGRRDLKTGCLVNCTDGGDGGYNPSTQTRLKMSLAKKGEKHFNWNKPLSKETKSKISNSISKQNISRKFFNKKTNEEVNVINLTLFCKERNIDGRHMYSVINGKRKSHKGWTYKLQ